MPNHNDRSTDPEPERRQEVLQEALSLVAERGIAGASLRRLAARLKLSQPSLYHYFKNKDDLIDQLVDLGARHMVLSMNIGELPQIPLARLPHFFTQRIFQLWEGETHARYVKFLFVVAIESPRHRPIIRRVFEQRLFKDPSQEIAQFFEQCPELAERLIQGLMMLARSLGLLLIEERILFGLDAPSDRARAHGQFVAHAVSQIILDEAPGA